MIKKWWPVFVITLLVLIAVAIGILFSLRGHRQEPERIFNVGLVLGAGGLGDRGFNDSAYEGLEKGNRVLGIHFHAVEYLGEAQTANIMQLAQENYDLIIAIGYENIAPLKEVAASFPDLRFAFLEEVVEAPNIISVVFRELEGDFLAGALCALLSSNGVVGFLGGADIPVIRRIEHGWREGARYINPEVTILVEYAGGINDFSAFSKPEIGQQLAEKMYRAQADIVYAAAGRTGLGAIRAAQETQQMIVTTSTDQRWIAPEVVISSRMKNLNTAVFMLLEELKAGTLRPGVRTLDLSTGGVGLAPLESERVPKEVRKKIADLYHQLIKGTIKVREYQPK